MQKLIRAVFVPPSFPLRSMVFPCLISGLAALLLSGCGRMDTILSSPPQTPETWLTIQPYLQFWLAGRPVVIVQPSSSALVYLLGIVAAAAGWRFLRLWNGQQSRRWWGIALVLWGVGALLAGTSYEAFSYQIKCAGRAACLWTSAWEIGYLILSVGSINAMLAAEAYACTQQTLRRRLLIYAAANMGMYLTTVLTGVLIPVQFLISFEMLLIFCTPAVLIFLILNGWRYIRQRLMIDRVLLITWGWLILTIAGYFGYYLSGLTQRLWAQGIWFSENDVLHLGLIAWMILITIVVSPRIKDMQPGSTPVNSPAA